MTHDYQKAKDIFLLALEKDPQVARNRFLDEACAGDLELRGFVVDLLDAHSEPDNFLRGNQDKETSLGRVDASVGDQIGPYKLLEVIGEGGMGTVYMAEQTEPVHRRVALKLIKTGMDTRQFVARFEAERQALAVMDHPSIAKVLDAGSTETGRPYLVMELVKGKPITKVCDELQLNAESRLKLFQQVCHAVQHAHQKGIIHRDIKPSNVLVAMYDDRPVPKVIDFGVAKATGEKLTEKTMFTRFGQIIGTLEYMSPEQAQFNQLDIDTRSDIYSLGAILYELLTGEPPFEREKIRKQALDETLRMIREDEPTKPSTKLSAATQLPQIASSRKTSPEKLGSILRGDLDWIVMKALEKDRTRRYETANGLALDIDRYLGDQPVSATPPSTSYRFRKFASRNKVGLAFASLIGLFFIAGLIGLGVSNYLLALREKETSAALQKADENFQIAQQNEKHANLQKSLALGVQDFLIEDLIGQTDDWSDNPDPQITLIDAVQIAATGIRERFSNQPLAEAAAYMSILPAFSQADEYPTAVIYARRAFDQRMNSLGPENPDTLLSQAALAGYLVKAGELKEAYELSYSALQICQRELSPIHDATIRSLQSITLFHMYSFDVTEAEKFNQQVLDAYLTKFGPKHRRSINSLIVHSDLKRRLKKFEEANSLAQKAVADAEGSLKENSLITLRARRNLAIILGDQGQIENAISECEQLLLVCRSSLGEKHLFTMETRRHLANCLVKAERFGEAEAQLRDLLKQFDQQKDSLGYLDTLLSLGDLYQKSKNWKALEANDRELFTLSSEKFGILNERGGVAAYNLAQALLAQMKYSELIEFMESQIPLIRTARNDLAFDLKETEIPPELMLSFCHCFLGVAYFGDDDNKKALSNLEESIALCGSIEKNPIAHSIKCTAFNTRAAVLAELGQYEEAAKAWVKYQELYTNNASAITAENLLLSAIKFGRLSRMAENKQAGGGQTTKTRKLEFARRAVVSLEHYLTEAADIDFERLDRVLSTDFQDFSKREDFQLIISRLDKIRRERRNQTTLLPRD